MFSHLCGILFPFLCTRAAVIPRQNPRAFELRSNGKNAAVLSHFDVFSISLNIHSFCTIILHVKRCTLRSKKSGAKTVPPLEPFQSKFR